MEKETKKQVVQNDGKSQQIDLSKMSSIELQALAFRVEQQIKALQRDYNIVYNELVKREEESQTEVNENVTN